MQSDIENNTKKIKTIPPFLTDMQLQKEKHKY